MSMLTKRAILAADERDRREAAKTKAEREARAEEFKAVTATAAEKAGAILECNVAPGTLKHEEQTWFDGESIAWRFGFEDLRFEVEHNNETGDVALYLIDGNDFHKVSSLAALGEMLRPDDA